MNCPVGGDAVVQVDHSCAENRVAEQDAASVVPTLELSPDGWRSEVANRLERYRARRKPREPRYPSLRLPFDSADSWLPVTSSALAVSPIVPAQDLTQEQLRSDDIPQQADHYIIESRVSIPEHNEQFTNLIEFPRSAALPAFHASELAEPVFERPRIVEVPEVLPPPPALGGILMEPSRHREPERRTDADLACPSASLSRRLLAGAIDALIVGTALAGFGAMFMWVNSQPPPLPVGAMAAALVSVILWAAYEFLFTVYTGSTPGLYLARLQLVTFTGCPTPRHSRLWRVLASYLSAFSLGLGYLWSVLDEDSLCWHDRITHTYLR
jgi:uncharacterized RDD family membrane protein YckC